MPINSDALSNLERFVADFGEMSSAAMAEKYGVARPLIGQGAALLRGLGVDIAVKSARTKSQQFDEELVERLFDGGAKVKDIAYHLTINGTPVKTVTLTRWLQKIGKLRKTVSLERVLANQF
jgi:hypothetical protein